MLEQDVAVSFNHPNSKAVHDFYQLPCLTVPFVARRLKNPRMLWLNQRWFEKHGTDIAQAEIRHRVEKALLDDFAVMAPSGLVNSNYLTHETVLMEADRYGESKGAFHGGSGRCAVKNTFIAKGIGRTPLVADHVDFPHSNGFFTLKDAIREAIYGEIAEAELPMGGIPTVAIIDAGFSVRTTFRPEEERCAISLRPLFIRPAHFLRSIYFGTAGAIESDQYKDSKRVSEAVKYMASPCGKDHGFIDIDSLCLSWARQLGSMYALLLWPGRFLTSNITLHGGVADFGSVQSVPNWNRLHSEVGEVFGNELDHLDMAVEAIKFSFEKYGPERHSMTAKELSAQCRKEVFSAMSDMFLNRLKIPSVTEIERNAFCDILKNIFFDQQKHRAFENSLTQNPVDLLSVFDEYHRTLISDDIQLTDSNVHQLILKTILYGNSGSYRNRFARHLGYRPALSYHRSVQIIHGAVQDMSHEAAICVDRLAAFIAEFARENIRIPEFHG